MLPELRHWFGITADEIDRMRPSELVTFVDRLGDLPPIGYLLIAEEG